MTQLVIKCQFLVITVDLPVKRRKEISLRLVYIGKSVHGMPFHHFERCEAGALFHYIIDNVPVP